MNVLNTKRNNSGGADLYNFTSGIEVDKLLAPYEIRVQCAWVDALVQGNYLPKEEGHKANSLLQEALGMIQKGSFEWRIEDEDIHMNLERFITERAGDLGKKIHVGRSRNDLIATTLRLYTNDVAKEASGQTRSLASALCDLAEKYASVIVPGTTHMQHGQPISFGHVLASHAWAFGRDIKRLKNTQKACLEYLPLGSAAFSGTSLKLDLVTLANKLGFESAPNNSYDAVGDRDFMIESLDAFASIAIHLGRLCEDVIYWSSTPVGLVVLPKNYSTGSSIMPNKRNPDVAEITRAKASRIIAAASEAHFLVKSVPTSYGSDLHELKKTFVGAKTELTSCLEIMVPFIEGIKLNETRAQELLSTGHILATEIADHLTSQGMAFRDAYKKVAQMVEIAESKGVQVHTLDSETIKSILPEIDVGFMRSLSAESAVEKRNNPGGTSIAQVKQGVQTLRKTLSE
ncbi:MAG: argininosuccinate lyase [Pseudomonadota bacterium]